MSKTFTPAPAAPIAPASQWAFIEKSAIAPEVSAILTELQKFSDGKLPRLALLRYNAKLEKVELSELVKQFDGIPRKAFDDSKPFADVLAALTPARLPKAAFESLKRQEARDLAGLLNEHGKNASVAAAVEKYLKITKFRPGWTDTLADKIKAAAPASEAAPAPASEAAPAPASDAAPASEAAPAPASDAAPAPARMAPRDLVPVLAEFIAKHCEAGKEEILRGMLARAVNDPATFRAFIGLPASDEKPGNVVEFSAPAPLKAAA